MLGSATLEKHRRIVSMMAEALGLDIETLRQRGRVPPGEMEAAVLACTQCDRSDACASWLMDFTARPEETPGYCRNRTRFAAFKAGV
ncbi:hypothetical protein FIU97_00445 [Roseivivax sp. THAF40]|uniref:DUF6455 family protein n=1 Tax=unclassified Roseivivax TaxID=2639302 RepID=UPI001268D685|nr:MULTISPECIES: DUF6455 family protein [unclassified Roseivivax]QFS81299.1 hypothetical protein FIV09_00530 [Roseivivax sp. THAF197b]QFT45028.1 hypothetical protein FIU97_00445 [Roseivivax sp. THAF40]